MNDRTLSPLIWTITERLCRTFLRYTRQHDNYEALVAKYVEREGKPRDQIRLDPVELAGLLNFKEMERIRDDYLLPLKDASHTLFRTADNTDFLDRLVNDVFHEMSILKEEHYNIQTYENKPESALDREELDTILNEVHAMFPVKVHRIMHLLLRARGRLEKLLPTFRENPVLIRSLYLHRKDFVAEAYPDGLVQFYRFLYGDDRAHEGYRAVGDSFFNAGFYELARESYQCGAEYLKSLAPQSKRKLDPSWKGTREHFKLRVREAEARLKSLVND
ncbi:MAG: hypothetical protein ACKVX7_11790 [Planctomycetota bacterium]